MSFKAIFVHMNVLWMRTVRTFVVTKLWDTLASKSHWNPNVFDQSPKIYLDVKRACVHTKRNQRNVKRITFSKTVL